MTTTVAAEPRNGLDRYFKISERGSTVSREVRGGLATFFTMAYIVVLNPLIIGTVPDKTGAVLGIPKVAAATALVAGVMTIIMGVAGRFPLAIATGLGLNAFVATALAPEMTWPEAMGLVVLEGIVIAILVLTGFRTAIFRAVPEGLKAAIGVGIGLFIALIGFVDGGFVRRVPDDAGTTVPVQLGIRNNLQSWPALVFVVGLLVTAVLVARRVKGAILMGIIGTTILAIIVEAIAKAGPTVVAPGKINDQGWSLNVPKLPGIHHIAGTPDLSLVGHFSLYGAFARVGVLAAVLFAFTLILADFFDAMGTVVGIGSEAGLLDERGTPPNIGTILFVDGVAAAAGGAGSVSSATGYVESAAGVGEGARTGLANVVTGVLFLLAMFLAPIVPDRAVRGGHAGAGRGRVPDDDPDPADRLQRLRDRHPGVPDHGDHAVHLLDHERDGRGLHLVRGHQGGAWPGAATCIRCCGWSPCCSSPTTRSSRSRPRSGSTEGSRQRAAPH